MPPLDTDSRTRFLLNVLECNDPAHQTLGFEARVIRRTVRDGLVAWADDRLEITDAGFDVLVECGAYRVARRA